MKNVLILMAFLTIGIGHAQRGEKRDHNKTPEQIASIQSKKMTLVLDLDNQQQIQIEQLLLKKAQQRQANKLTKEERAQLTDAKKIALREQQLDQKISMKRKMKRILTADQYEKWEKMMARKARGKKKGKRKNMRGNRNN